jgi:HEAT repeat protein
VKALGSLGGEGSLEPLVRAIGDPDENVRREAASALEAMGSRAVAPLAEALRGESREGRREAARALGRIRDPGAIESLIPLLQDQDPGVRDEALIALGRMGGSAVKPLVKAMREKGFPDLTGREGKN